MLFTRNISALFILGLVALSMVLFADETSALVHAKKIKKLKKLGAVLLLLKSKKPKFGVLPIPLPVPVPLKFEKVEPPIYITKKAYGVPVQHNIPVAEPYAEPYPVMDAPQYVDAGYAGGYGGGAGGYGAGGYAAVDAGAGGYAVGGGAGYGAGGY